MASRRRGLLVLAAGACVVLLAVLLSVWSGHVGDRTGGPPPVPGERPPDLPAGPVPGGTDDLEPSAPDSSPDGAGPGGPGKLVPFLVTTDGRTYAPGEPVEVRMVLRNEGSEPVEVRPAEPSRSWHHDFVITTKKGQYGYDPERPRETAVVAPGDVYEYVCLVELRDTGRTTIEGPYPPFVCQGPKERFRVSFYVFEHGDPEHLFEKIERLASRIETERDLFAPSIWTQAQMDLEKMGKVAVPRLREMLRESGRAQARAVAAKLLGRLKATEAVPDLVEALRDPASEVRKGAVETLGTFKAPETFEAIAPLIDDSDRWVRDSAVDSVAAFGLAMAKPFLVRALDDEERFVRTSAASELAKGGDDAGIEVLMEALRIEPLRYMPWVAEPLEALTGQSFGLAPNIMSISGSGQAEKAAERCREVARKWLEWWDSGGRRRPK